jgi:hypothetical protein
MSSKRKNYRYEKESKNPSKDRNVTGKELNVSEETVVGLDTLIEMLSDKGVINKREYQSTVAMRLHEMSKATAFEEMDHDI